MGVAASPPGCQPSASAASADATASSQSGIPNAMARPKRYDPAIVRFAAEQIASECERWDPSTPASDWVDPLIREVHHWTDGYDLARQLERYHHVQPNSELVETLDGAYHHLTEAHEDALRKWAKIVGWTPAFAVGDMVECRLGVGPIHAVYAELGQYVVDVERRGNGGYILNAEDVRAASGIEARSDETAQPAQPEGREPARTPTPCPGNTGKAVAS